MNKDINRHREEQLRAYPITDIVEGWFFQIEEISYGYYRVSGIDSRGRSVSREGMNVEDLVGNCRIDIIEMQLED